MFRVLTKSRFGWVNASYVYGLTIINGHMRRALGTLVDWDAYARSTMDIAIPEDDVFQIPVLPSGPVATGASVIEAI